MHQMDELKVKQGEVEKDAIRIDDMAQASRRP